MRVDSHSGRRGMLFDGERPIRWAVWYDTATGEYEAFRIDPKDARRLKIPLSRLRYRGRSARLHFKEAILQGTMPAPVLPSPRKGRRCVIDPMRKCGQRDCWRVAEWITQDERLLTPAVVAGRSFETAEEVGEPRYWCSHHYRMPNLVHPDGSMDPVDVQRGRPE